MQTIKTRELCRILGVSTGKVEQMINRGIVRPDSNPEQGKSREWTIGDAFRLMLACDLTELGVGAGRVDADVHSAIQNVFGFNDEAAFLVVSIGKLGRLIPASERGAPAPSDADCVPVHIPGRLYSQIVEASKLATLLANPDRHASAVINLDARFAALEIEFKRLAGDAI